MRVDKIKNTQNFKGKFITVGKIYPQQRYLLQQYLPEMSKLIKDKPYDLFIKESKSKKSIIISTDKNFINKWFGVSKKEKNYIDATNNAIEQKELELAEAQQFNVELGLLYLEQKYKFSL